MRQSVWFLSRKSLQAILHSWTRWNLAIPISGSIWAWEDGTTAEKCPVWRAALRIAPFSLPLLLQIYDASAWTAWTLTGNFRGVADADNYVALLKVCFISCFVTCFPPCFYEWLGKKGSPIVDCITLRFFIVGQRNYGPRLTRRFVRRGKRDSYWRRPWPTRFSPVTYREKCKGLLMIS